MRASFEWAGAGSFVLAIATLAGAPLPWWAFLAPLAFLVLQGVVALGLVAALALQDDRAARRRARRWAKTSTPPS